MLRPTIAVVLLVLATAGLAQELPVTGIRYLPAPANQENPAAASDGTNFLVAWRDNRELNGYQSIFAARVAPDGRLLDEPTAIAVPDAHDVPPSSSTNSRPAVAWTGEVWVVVWLDPAVPGWQLVRIDRDGVVLDARPRTIPDPRAWSTISAATAGDRTLLVYSRDNTIHAILLDRAGEIVDGDMELAGTISDSPTVAASSDGFLVAWRHWTGTASEIHVRPVSRGGVPGATRNAGGTSTLTPLLAASGNDFLLAHTDVLERIITERLDAEGRTTARNILPEAMANPFPQATLKAHRDGYLLVHSRYATLPRMIALDREGRLTGAQTPVDAPNGATVALASNGSATLIAWAPTQEGGFGTDVYARILDMQDEATLLSLAAPTQSNAAIATNGQGYLAAFLNWPVSAELRVARLAPNGARLDDEGILLSTRVRTPPRVVFDGRNYVVAWKNYDECTVRMSRMAADGTLLDGAGGRAIGEGCGEAFGLATNGNETLLVWNGVKSLAALRMKQDGTLDATPLRIASDERPADDFSIAWAAGTWLVVWREVIIVDSIHFPVSYHNLRAARISDSWNVLDGVPVTISDSKHEEERPSVSSNGRDFLVAWSDETSVVSARRVAINGVAGAPFEIAAGRKPSVAARGDDYLIAWERDGDLFYASLAARTPLRLAAGADVERGVTLVATPRGFAAVYERVASERLYGSIPRVFLRLFAFARTRAVRH